MKGTAIDVYNINTYFLLDIDIPGHETMMIKVTNNAIMIDIPPDRLLWFNF